MPSDRVLAYATGGLAYGHGSVSTNSVVLLGGNACAFFAGCGSGSTSGWRAGWTVGGGLEWAFTDRWSAKGEYLSVNFRGNIVRVGLNYKFN